MRLIDVDVLKEELGIAEDCDDCERLGAHGCVNSTWAIVCDRIESAPTIDAVPRWIPCEERLPEKEEKAYLVYLDNGHVCECRWWCLDPVFLKPADNWRWHLMDKPQYTKVLAWMPLPEPYGERRDDEIV